jgi:SAM-dependent methyltransferase
LEEWELTRFYSDLARWWPLISPVADYAGEAAEFRRVIRTVSPDATTVLELGSGGGHNACYLKRHYTLTLTDLSTAMLAVSRQLNPECEHVAGDMRSLELGRPFDVVFAHDAIDYMLTETDLAAAIATAWRHCRPGGVAIFVPDDVRESFTPDTDCGGTDAPDGAGVRYLEWSYDPDPADSTTTTEYAFLTRDADGTVSSHSETHLSGLFPRATWLRLIEQQGFAAEAIEEHTDEERHPRTIFVGRRRT